MFITVFGQVGAVMTKGDLQKAPVRLWLFGLISLLEMQMLRLIRERFPRGAWMSLLHHSRAKAARRLHVKRRRRNEEADPSDFSDCLQICDKVRIVLADSELSAVARFSTPGEGERFINRLQSLRNDLAHANDLLKGRWPDLADLALETEAFLQRLEGAFLREKP